MLFASRTLQLSLLLGAMLPLSGPTLASKTPAAPAKRAADANALPLTVHADQPGIALSPDLYGVFFEEINHAGDGGLYAEKIQNGRFAEGMKGWKALDLAQNTVAVTAKDGVAQVTLNKTTKGNTGGILNEGYWGIGVEKGQAYRCTFDIRADNPKIAFIVSLDRTSDGHHLLDDNTGLDTQNITGVSDRWKRVTVTLHPNDAAPHASLLFSGLLSDAQNKGGSFWIRNVSLMPVQTFKKRANGLRVDLAQDVNALHPAFVRFPGGCYVEGNVLANRFNWKDTLGDPMLRPGHLNDNWNYRSSDGLGYHEYLQWCEDMKATPLFVVNCGMSHKQFVPISELVPWVQDALDAIEYANGPVTSKWGALRAKNGHPAPFKLKYIEIGNENGLFGANFGGSREQYAERYKIFFDAIKTHYPDIVTIANTRVPHPIELVDDHYYNSPAWFWANVGLYDKYNRSDPKVYVGEYAVTSDCGTGNLKAALAEAAWMTGLERNGDVIKMTSYAPLFVNANDRKWNPDAIVFDSAQSYGTPSYYVQKLYSLNRPDTAFRVDVPNAMSEPNIGKGGIGLDTWLTQAEFKDITVTQGAKTIYASDFAQGASDWKPVRGDWKVVDGAYRQAGEGTDRRSVLVAPQLKDLQDYTLRLKARKISGAEGFIVMFRVTGENNYWWNIGGWHNREHGIEKNVNGAHIDMGSHVPGHIETGKWYDIRVEAEDNRVRCYLDDKLVFNFEDKGLPTLAATAGRVDKTGEVIVKVVNGGDTARPLQINLDGIANVQPTAQVTVMAGDSLEAENSLAQPTRIAPITTTLTGIAPHFVYSAPPRSVSILRLKTR